MFQIDTTRSDLFGKWKRISISDGQGENERERERENERNGNEDCHKQHEFSITIETSDY